MTTGRAISKRSLLLIFFLYGLALTTLQIVYLRFFISIFYGNELTIGLFLFSWMLWSAAGSYWFGKVKNAREYLPSHHFLFGMIIPFTLLLMLVIRIKFVPIGSVLPGLPLTIFTALLALVAFGLLSGGLFSLYARLFQKMTNSAPDVAGSRVYLWETSGSLFGGLLSGLVFIRLFSATQIVVGLAVLQFVLAFYFLSRTEKKRKNLILTLYFLLGLLALTSFLSSYQNRYAQLWQGMKILTHRASPYGDLVLTQLDHSYTLYQDGVPLFTVPDPQTAEETVHYALLMHRNPQNVLLIGGGFTGALFEVLKHPSVKALHYVELDPEVIAIYRQYFPENWQQLMADQRVHIHQTDGRTFLKNTTQTFDLIISAVPDPYTVQLNRFFSREFFALCYSRLNNEGLFSFQVSAAENYLNDSQIKYLKAIQQSFEPVFANWCFLPGQKVRFFLFKSTTPCSVSADSLIATLKRRHLKTLFVQEYYIPFKLMPDRIALFEKAFASTQFPFYNSDFRPLAYYFDTILWAGKTSTVVASLFKTLLRFSFTHFVVFVFLPLILFWLILRVYRPAIVKRLVAPLGMFTVGFSVISLELLILIVFQVSQGYVYQQIAVFIALFMGGMALGSLLGLKVTAKTELLTAVGILGAILAFSVGSVTLMRHLISFSASLPVFYFLAVVSGFLGGCAFPVFNGLYQSHSSNGGNSGVIYAWDLIGSLAGSLLSSLILIPIYGLTFSAYFLAILNLLMALFILLSGAEKRKI